MDTSKFGPGILTPADHNITFKVEGKEDGIGYLATQNRDAQ